MKGHEADSKVDFPIKSSKKKKDKLSGLPEHLKRKKHQLDWTSIKILAKKNNYWKHRSNEVYFITKHKDKAPLLNKKRNSRRLDYLENDFTVLWKILTQKNNFLKIWQDLKLVSCKRAI